MGLFRLRLGIRKHRKVISCLCALILLTLLLGKKKDGFTTNDPNGTVGQDSIRAFPTNSIEHVVVLKETKSNQSVQLSTHDKDDYEYTKRQENTVKACREKKNSEIWLKDWPGIKREPSFRNKPMISTKTKLFFCLVGKVASSFFTRWVISMNKPGPMHSPYTILMKDAGRGRAEDLTKIPQNKRVDFLQTSTRIVFGRNPYSRIFSAYVDKLFSPNPFYWAYWGKQSVQLDDNRATIKRCGSDVTFAQFVNAVVMKIAQADVHLIPVTEECNTCQMPYNVVGKLESTVDDLDYASKLLNISSSFQHEPSYKAVAQKDIILDAVNSAFSWKNSIKNCQISLDEMGQRMWRKFQIRGVIDSAIKYPLKSGEIDKMTSSKFIEICEQAIRNSTDEARLKRQRKLAMKLAYSTVPKEVAAKIKDIYELDFAYFEYEREPDFISEIVAKDLNLKENSLIFHWRTPWTID